MTSKLELPPHMLQKHLAVRSKMLAEKKKSKNHAYYDTLQRTFKNGPTPKVSIHGGVCEDRSHVHFKTSRSSPHHYARLFSRDQEFVVAPNSMLPPALPSSAHRTTYQRPISRKCIRRGIVEEADLDSVGWTLPSPLNEIHYKQPSHVASCIHDARIPLDADYILRYSKQSSTTSVIRKKIEEYQSMDDRQYTNNASISNSLSRQRSRARTAAVNLERMRRGERPLSPSSHSEATCTTLPEVSPTKTPEALGNRPSSRLFETPKRYRRGAEPDSSTVEYVVRSRSQSPSMRSHPMSPASSSMSTSSFFSIRGTSPPRLDSPSASSHGCGARVVSRARHRDDNRSIRFNESDPQWSPTQHGWYHQRNLDPVRADMTDDIEDSPRRRGSPLNSRGQNAAGNVEFGFSPRKSGVLTSDEVHISEFDADGDTNGRPSGASPRSRR